MGLDSSIEDKGVSFCSLLLLLFCFFLSKSTGDQINALEFQFLYRLSSNQHLLFQSVWTNLCYSVFAWWVMLILFLCSEKGLFEIQGFYPLMLNLQHYLYLIKKCQYLDLRFFFITSNLFTFLSFKPYSLYFAAEGGIHILGMAHHLIMKRSLVGNPSFCHWEANRSLYRLLGCLNRRDQPLAEGCCLPMIRHFQIQWEKEFLLPALLAFSENWFSVKAAK